MSKIKQKVDEFAAIATALPENLQITCFELLLKHHLEGMSRPQTEQKATASDVLPSGPLPPVSATPPSETGSKQEDLKLHDLHVKARKFLEKYALSVEQLNNLYFKERAEIRPLYEDLKTTRLSESQIRVTLLLALQNAITTGEFESDVNAVRDECIKRKCYDGKNFSNNYNNNASLFDFEKYTAVTKSVRLSEPGRKELADLIQEMQ